jgi:ABC-type transporter Mla subunit MlaD
LDFINKVKTTKPIPWINEFDDITSVKKEIQKKMLNELAELFLIKNKHFETVIDSFNKVMDSLSLEEQRKALGKISATKEITDAVEKLEGFKNELEETKLELEEAKTNNSKDKDKFEKKISSLLKKITELENETLSSSSSQFFIKDGQVKIGNPNYLDSNFINSGSGVTYNTGSLGSTVFGFNSKKCDSCGKLENNPLRIIASVVSVFGSQFNTCSSCKRLLCGDCWPQYNPLTTASAVLTIGQNNKCPKCVKEGK